MCGGCWARCRPSRWRPTASPTSCTAPPACCWRCWSGSSWPRSARWAGRHGEAPPSWMLGCWPASVGIRCTAARCVERSEVCRVASGGAHASCPPNAVRGVRLAPHANLLHACRSPHARRAGGATCGMCLRLCALCGPSTAAPGAPTSLAARCGGCRRGAAAGCRLGAQPVSVHLAWGRREWRSRHQCQSGLL